MRAAPRSIGAGGASTSICLSGCVSSISAASAAYTKQQGPSDWLPAGDHIAVFRESPAARGRAPVLTLAIRQRAAHPPRVVREKPRRKKFRVGLVIEAPIRQLPSYAGSESAPSVSPDGWQVASSGPATVRTIATLISSALM